MKILGRKAEKEILKDFLDSKKAEFLAIYGRRRIGKTFLIKEFFFSQKILFFNVTGSKNGTLREQVKHFTEEIGRCFYNGTSIVPGKNWDESFHILTNAFKNLAARQKIVLFFDELPWMATKNSKLLTALDYFWNQHWSSDKRIKLIICGSSASWIVEKIINNKGGLHNRITKKIHLMPFNLREAKEFLYASSIKLTNSQITQLYMVTGGVPYYLSEVKNGLTAAQNIDKLAFTKGGLFISEFENLFSSLFDNHELSVSIIRLMSQYKTGINQEDIFKTLGENIKGKVGLQKLAELEYAGFIVKFKPYMHHRKGIYYKLIDEYTLFYLKWIEPLKNQLLLGGDMSGYWERQIGTANWYIWAGYAFEAIIYKHIAEVRGSLNLDVSALPSTWRYNSKQNKGAEIDLLFDRRDGAITICEIKFTNKPFSIDKSYAQNLENKIKVFKEVTKTNKQIFLAIISALGLKNNQYSTKLVNNVVGLENLFEMN